MHRLWLTAN